MKRKLANKVVAYIFLFIGIICYSPYALAHPASQEGILARTYNSQYGRYYIGGEDFGWSIDESYHTNGTTVTYNFSSTDQYLTDTYKSYVINGASLWSGTVNIVNREFDNNGTGLISTTYNDDTQVYARFYDYFADSSGHLTSWKIEMNRAKPLSATVLAHEFGHAIGLNDLYDARNSGKLMYGVVGGTATAPTSSDIWGAKVITGVHTAHTWGYKYWKSNAFGNMHIKYCTICNGLTATTGQCK